MAQNYSRPGDRVRSFGVGILTGDVMAGGDMLNKVQSNVKFRIESARQMVVGGDMEQSMAPLERRQQLRERRLGLLKNDEGESTSTSTPMGSSSGSLGQSSSGNNTSTASSTESSTPSMSEVNAGTKKRANDRGFGQ